MTRRRILRAIAPAMALLATAVVRADDKDLLKRRSAPARADEAVQGFASATVSSVQPGNRQMAFLATFSARSYRSVWDGALRAYALQTNGAIIPVSDANPVDGTPCVLTIKDQDDPQYGRQLPVPCNDPSILKWNAQIGLSLVPLSGDGNGVAELTPGSDYTKTTYSDVSNDAPHAVDAYYYEGRRIVWSLPATFSSLASAPATQKLPINGSPIAGAEAIPEQTYSFLNTPAAGWWPKLKLLLTPQTNPPTAGRAGCGTPPCTIDDTDAGQTIRFIRGDRDRVMTEILHERHAPVYPASDARWYASPSGPLKLGDVFHSNPQLIGEPENFFYYSANLHGYVDFFRNYRHRRRVLLAGSNDGLVHGFDAGVWGRSSAACTDRTSNCYDFGTGTELFAYAPRSVMQNFKRLKDAIGAQDVSDEWTADGALAAADMYIDTNHAGTPIASSRRWRTIVVGSAREGSPFEGMTSSYDVHCESSATTAFQNNASSIYALDVTTPDPVESSGIESTGGKGAPACLDAGDGCTFAWPRVLWEFQDPTMDVSNTYANMGEAWSKPGLGRICLKSDASGSCTDERFVAVFGGGFDRERRNLRGNWFYILDVETGFVLYKVSSGVDGGGTTVGFASIPAEPSAIDYDGDGLLDVVYFGDLLGQVWRLDLTSLKLPSGAPAGRYDSKITRGDGNPLKPFLVFQAPQPNASPIHKYYPIYHRPVVVALGLQPNGRPKLGLAFGTGDRDDVGALCPTAGTNLTRSTSLGQRYYFVIDRPGSTLHESDLMTIAASSTSTAPNTATIPESGWVLRLGTTGPTAGERVITNSLVANGYVYFFTAVPTVAGTNARGYVVHYANGNSLPEATDRGSTVPDASFATDPVFYVSGNKQGNVAFTTNHGVFLTGKSNAGTRVTVKNWKEN